MSYLVSIELLKELQDMILTCHMNSDGQLHCEDGPAVIMKNGSIGWWLNDDPYSFENYCIVLTLTKEQIVFLKLKYGELK